MKYLTEFTVKVDNTKIKAIHAILVDIHNRANKIKKIDPNFNFKKYLADCF